MGSAIIFAQQQFSRSGSLAAARSSQRRVRFTPESCRGCR